MHQGLSVTYHLREVQRLLSMTSAVITLLLFITTKDVTLLAFVFKKLSIFNQHALDSTVGRPCYLKMAQVKSMENVG